ncbi:hypothetical protein [Pedobacter sp. UYEF25]
MQDKDFDKVFKDRLQHAEVEPSVGLWSAIETKITPKKRVLNLRNWLIAASMVLMAAVTLVIYQQQQILPSPTFTTVTRTVEKGKVEKQTSPIETEKNGNLENTITLVERTSKPTKLASKSEHRKLVAQAETDPPLDKVGHDDLVAKNNNLPQSLNPQTKEVSIAPDVKPLHENMVLAAVEQSPQETPIAEEHISTSRGIKSAGDLINLVVGAVDKGKNKFIMFNTNDEGSTLAAVNIGPFRFGKRND